MERDGLIPAPGRGAYDRSLSRGQRDAQQRERLLAAASAVLADGPLTVSRVVRRAGVGRSTFYEFFDSPSHLLEQLTARTLKTLATSLDQELASARTPLERAGAVARAWLSEWSVRSSEAAAALIPRATSDLLSPAGRTLLAALSRAADSSRPLPDNQLGAAEDSRLLAAAAAVEAVTRRHLAGPALADPQQVLTDILSRLLR